LTQMDESGIGFPTSVRKIGCAPTVVISIRFLHGKSTAISEGGAFVQKSRDMHASLAHS
jgi:hypothetical protein